MMIFFHFFSFFASKTHFIEKKYLNLVSFRLQMDQKESSKGFRNPKLFGIRLICMCFRLRPLTTMANGGHCRYTIFYIANLGDFWVNFSQLSSVRFSLQVLYLGQMKSDLPKIFGVCSHRSPKLNINICEAECTWICYKKGNYIAPARYMHCCMHTL